MSNQKPHAIVFFKKELEMIQDSTLNAFFANALAVAPESFHQDEELLKISKKAFHILRGLLDGKGVEGAVRDALLGTSLLCDIMYNEFDEDSKELHTVAVRSFLKKHQVHKDVQQGLWENVMRAIEAHEGEEGVSPILAAKPGTAEDEIARAYAIANLDYITLDWEVLYHEGNKQEEN